MSDANDMDLLREYADRNSESAFAELVRRHINLSYSVALRFTENSPDAEDITQAVFVILAKKAASLRAATVLTGWIYETTRLSALQFLRSKARRHQHEQEAHMQSLLEKECHEATWQQLRPLLEDAMSKLSEKDRTLLALRYFENRSNEESAALLDIGDWAARKRAARALEKLRRFFSSHGVDSTTAVIAGAISANSLQIAPAALAKSVTTVAMTKGAAGSASTLTFIKGALKLMAWTKANTALVVGISVMLAVGTATVCVKRINSRSRGLVDPRTVDESFWRLNLKTLIKAPQVAAVRHSPSTQTGEVSTDTRMVARGASLGSLLYYAYAPNNIYYQFNREYRTILAPGVSDGKFDVLLTTTNHPRETLQAEIKKELGVVAHFEARDMDVLVLKPADTGSRLTASSGNGSVRLRRGELDFTNQPAYALIDFLQNNFDMLVDDQSGLTDHYTGQLKWIPQPDKTANQREVQTALSSQLGLELVPGHETIQMLVVEKAK